MHVDLKDYGRELTEQLSTAWELARKCVAKAQRCQKKCADRQARPRNFVVADRVFLFQPAEKTGKARKLARPYHGPFRVVSLTQSNAQIRRVDRPQDEPILVALGRLRRCPSEVPDTFWPPAKKRRAQLEPGATSIRRRGATYPMPDYGRGRSPTTRLQFIGVERPSASVYGDPASRPVFYQQVVRRLQCHPRTADS